jgi:hypothetical protein
MPHAVVFRSVQSGGGVCRSCRRSQLPSLPSLPVTTQYPCLLTVLLAGNRLGLRPLLLFRTSCECSGSYGFPSSSPLRLRKHHFSKLVSLRTLDSCVFVLACVCVAASAACVSPSLSSSDGWSPLVQSARPSRLSTGGRRLVRPSRLSTGGRCSIGQCLSLVSRLVVATRPVGTSLSSRDGWPLLVASLSSLDGWSLLDLSVRPSRLSTGGRYSISPWVLLLCLTTVAVPPVSSRGVSFLASWLVAGYLSSSSDSSPPCALHHFSLSCSSSQS